MTRDFGDVFSSECGRGNLFVRSRMTTAAADIVHMVAVEDACHDVVSGYTLCNKVLIEGACAWSQYRLEDDASMSMSVDNLDYYCLSTGSHVCAIMVP